MFSLDPFNGNGILNNGENMTEETNYKCDECGEDWDGESCFGYVSDVCANCGALEVKHKVPEEKE